MIAKVTLMCAGYCQTIDLKQGSKNFFNNYKMCFSLGTRNVSPKTNSVSQLLSGRVRTQILVSGTKEKCKQLTPYSKEKLCLLFSHYVQTKCMPPDTFHP